jgi:hypothetical protein
MNAGRIGEEIGLKCLQGDVLKTGFVFPVGLPEVFDKL